MNINEQGGRGWTSRALNRLLNTGALMGVARFFITQRISGYDVPRQPLFDSPESTAWFIERLNAAEVYLEYGSGGSTFLAATEKKRFFTRESDRFFLEAVKKLIASNGLFDPERQSYFHADIGLTGPWGAPIVLSNPPPSRLDRFRRYSDVPEGCLPGGYVPDLILVDGRFRAACALKLIRALHGEAGWTLIVDDYVGRNYGIIEEFAELTRMVGRMAVFNDRHAIDRDALDKAIRYHELVWD